MKHKLLAALALLICCTIATTIYICELGMRRIASTKYEGLLLGSNICHVRESLKSARKPFEYSGQLTLISVEGELAPGLMADYDIYVFDNYAIVVYFDVLTNRIIRKELVYKNVDIPKALNIVR